MRFKTCRLISSCILIQADCSLSHLSYKSYQGNIGTVIYVILLWLETNITSLVVVAHALFALGQVAFWHEDLPPQLPLSLHCTESANNIEICV